MISRTVSLLLIFWYVFVFFATTCVSDLFAAFAMNRLNSWLVVIYYSCGMFLRFGSLCLHGGLQPENLHHFSRFAVVFAIELGIRLGLSYWPAMEILLDLLDPCLVMTLSWPNMIFVENWGELFSSTTGCEAYRLGCQIGYQCEKHLSTILLSALFSIKCRDIYGLLSSTTTMQHHATLQKGLWRGTRKESS